MTNSIVCRFFLCAGLLFVVGCTSSPPPAEVLKAAPKDLVESSITKKSGDGLTAKPALKKKSKAITYLYKVYWGGIDVGDLAVERIEAGDTYRFSAEMRSRNMAKLISGYRSSNAGKVIDKKNGTYRPASFFTNFQLRNKVRNIKIEYDNIGRIVKEESRPPENRNKRPEVPKAQKDKAFDPFSAYLTSREKIRLLLKKNQKGSQKFTLPLYDGRRYSNLHITYHGLDENNNVHISMETEPVSGYTNNELQTRLERPSEIQIYLDSKTLIPLRATGRSMVGSEAVAMLEKICHSMAECLPE